MLWLASLPLLPIGAGRAFGADDSAADVLRREHRLVRKGDNVWMLPEEVRLRQKLAELPKLKDSIVELERELEERIEQNRRAWQENAPARSSVKQSIDKLSPRDPQRKALQAQLDAMAKVAIDPMRLAGRDDVRARLVEFGQHRATLAIALLWLRSAWPLALQEYATLAESQEVTQALRQLAGEHRLGPARNYEPDLRRLGEYERLVFTKWLPIYQQSGQTRVTVIVNERSPLTFTWSDASNQQTVLTAGALDALGLQVPGDAPQTTMKFGKSRTMAARQITLEALRLGRTLVKSVTAHVLPPEGEDLGSRIGRTALAEHSVRLDPERLRMVIEVRNEQ